MKKNNYSAIIYKDGNVLERPFLGWDNFKDIDLSMLEKHKKIMDKIKVFKLNNNEDGMDLINELRIDDIIEKHIPEEFKILDYKIITKFESVFLSVVYEVTPEYQKQYNLFNIKRCLNIRLIQSETDQSSSNWIDAAYTN